jgi:hypothetical protein
MAQEFDIAEYWENFDDRSVFIQRPLTPEIQTEETKEQSDHNFINHVDEFIASLENNEYEVSSDEDIQKNKKQKIFEDQEKIVKKMYGCKEKHYSLLTEEDIFIKNKIEEIFNFMKKQNS